MNANLTDQNRVELARILREVIEADSVPVFAKVKRWKELLSKLDPPAERVVMPYPPPRPSAQPSHLLAKKRRR